MSSFLVAAALLTASAVDDAPSAIAAAPLGAHVECDGGWLCRLVSRSREPFFRRGWRISCTSDGHFTYCRTDP